MTMAPDDESLQLDLLQGFDVPAPHLLGSTAEEDAAVVRPIARVHIDSHVPHLDRLFDYTVPARWDELAQPGVRVRVKFGGREVGGWLRERVERSDSPARLVPLHKVVSAVRVVRPEIFDLADALADRYAGLVPDVLRLAIPPRVARLEEGEQALDAEVECDYPLDESLLEGFQDYINGPEFCEDLLAGAEARAVLTALPQGLAQPWEKLLAAALVATAHTGRGALAVVPDHKALNRLSEALDAVVGPGAYARLTASDKPTPRYQNFLKALTGRVRIVIGTRSAAYAPVTNLGLVACWDDGDSNLVEQRAPYCQVRDVLLLRATQEKTAALFLGHAVSSEAARLVRTRWASHLRPDRTTLRSHSPRVLPTGDDYQLARDPLAAIARIPHQAFTVAQQALTRGPVLIQVARAGYIPALSCQRCRFAARCDDCHGPLTLTSGTSTPQCGWCGHLAHSWHCTECHYDRWRSGMVGALRTAEELGRAFPDVPVITSSGENIRPAIGPEPALVIATPGGEPVAPGGYAAALLLDADRMLQFDSLRAPESALRRWFNAAALVRPFHQGGQVITTASPSPTLEALVRWDPMGYALWELDERHEIGLPPAVRTAAITGSETAVSTFCEALDLPEDIHISGPVPLIDPSGFYEGEAEGQLYRAIIFFTYTQGHQLTRHLRSVKASLSALKKSEPVQIRCDGLDIL
ncbi:primosomal protein N' [Rothia nasimurium]|uniref:primosomal protein N' n=1 Tax=Rothia nasimurium TaxID=85336 RepID=UPI001F353A1B|nr:primosomal protein N' [Rothia nasimurium]